MIGSALHLQVYPRVGGGTVFCGGPLPSAVRSIPAWAGEPLLHRGFLLLNTVYPRVGGGTG